VADPLYAPSGGYNKNLLLTVQRPKLLLVAVAPSLRMRHGEEIYIVYCEEIAPVGAYLCVALTVCIYSTCEERSPTHRKNRFLQTCAAHVAPSFADERQASTLSAKDGNSQRPTRNLEEGYSHHRAVRSGGKMSVSDLIPSEFIPRRRRHKSGSGAGQASVLGVEQVEEAPPAQVRRR